MGTVLTVLIVIASFGSCIAILCAWRNVRCQMCKNRLATLDVDEIAMCDECAEAFLHPRWARR